jgi:hypothetical protein
MGLWVRSGEPARVYFVPVACGPKRQSARDAHGGDLHAEAAPNGLKCRLATVDVWL